MYDPFQSYQTLGAYAGGATPYGLPYGAQPASQVLAGPTGNPLATQLLGYGIHPQLLQQIQLLQQLQQIEQIRQLQAQAYGPAYGPGNFGQPNPILQQTLAQALQNPLLTGLQTHIPNPALGYAGSPQQQFGNPLLPQSLVGVGGQGYGQINPLAAQWAIRTLAGGGITPWGY